MHLIPNHYVWFVWSSAFVLPWGLLYWRFPRHRKAMLWASICTLPFGLTEPLFVPAYWNPPSLFDLAQRTGFDVESLIFSFGIGGVAAVLVEALTGRVPLPIDAAGQLHPRHRFHRWALFAPFVLFVVLLPTGWNPIYLGILAMVAGAGLSVWCRPDLTSSTVLGGLVFLLYYVIFLVGLEVTAPSGYIKAVWNLEHLSGIVIGFMPLEELLFAIGFGMYWAGVYEHVTWSRSEAPLPH